MIFLNIGVIIYPYPFGADTSLFEVVNLKQDELKDFPELFIKYFSYQSAVVNKSKLTVLEYASDLRSFLRFLMIQNNLADSKTEFEEISVESIPEDVFLNATNQDVYAFAAYCRNERDNNENTRMRKMSSIRSFYKWLTVNEKILKSNPMESLDSPKAKKSLPKYLTLDESLELLRSIDGPNRQRDYCIITFFLNCGLRLSEIVSLNCKDIRPDKSMKVTGKGNKERIVYLNDSCMKAYYDYMKVRPTEGIIDKNALFISRNKKRISPKTVQHIVYSLLDKAGLGDRGFSVHKLRHTAATLMYQHGNADVLLLKEMLGHESLSTTQIYTHVVDDQLRKAMDSNPLNIQSTEIEQTDE